MADAEVCLDIDIRQQPANDMVVGKEAYRLACTDRLCILIGSRSFVTLSPLIGQQATFRRQNMTCGPKNSDKSLRVPDLIARLVEGK